MLRSAVDAQAFPADAQLGLEPVLLGEPRLGEERVQAGARLLEDVVGPCLAERTAEIVHADRRRDRRIDEAERVDHRPTAVEADVANLVVADAAARPRLRRQPVAGLDVEADVVVEARRPRQRREGRQRDRERRGDHGHGRHRPSRGIRPAHGRHQPLDRPRQPGAAEDAQAQRRRRRVPVVERHPQQRVGDGERPRSTPAAAGTAAAARWRRRRRRSTATGSAASPARNRGSGAWLSHRNRRSQSTRPRPNVPHRPLSRCASLAGSVDGSGEP